MALATLRDNQLIRWRGRLLKLVGRLPDGDWHLVDIGSGLIDKQSDTTLWAEYEQHALVFVCNSDPCAEERDKKLQNLLTEAARVGPPEQGESPKRHRAFCRWRYVQATRGLTIEQIASIAGELRDEIGWPATPPHANSIHNWKLKTDHSSDPLSALVERDDRKGRHGYRHDKDVIDLVRTVRDEDYLKSNPRIRMAEAVRRVADKVRVRNGQFPRSEHWPIPGRRTFQSVLNEVPDREINASRYGPDAALSKFRTSLGGVAVRLPLDRCEVDHTMLSVIVLDEDFVPWGRLANSIALDVKTRNPLGVYWGAETPSTVSLARCIRHSAMPKTEFMKNFPNVKGRWKCFGVAKTYDIDNGFEEWAEAFQNALSEMGGSVLEFGGRKSPWHKPHVERYLRNQDLGLIHNLPGTTMENILKRSKFNPKRDFLLRRSTFDRIYMKWLVDVYMNTPQACLDNESPNEVWNRLIVGVDQYVPSKTVLLERLFLRCEKGRTLDHEGIEYDCLVYNSADMGALRVQRGSIIKLDIFVSDEDLGHIQVVVPDSDIWIRVPCLNMKYAKGLTRWQHEKCKQMRKVLRSEGRELSLAEAREGIRWEIANEMKEFRLAHRKKRSRFKESTVGGYWDPDPTQTPNDTRSSSEKSGNANGKGKTGSNLTRDPKRTTPLFNSFISKLSEDEDARR